MMTRAAFRPSTLPDAPADLRAAAAALAARLVAVGCGSDATTLRGASKCWTVSRAAKSAASSLPYDCADATLFGDLLDLSTRAAGIGHRIADAARTAAVSL
jgi:hypothetical protein